ncbi:MAG TPA: DUF721 domain-containing protein [Anseongella sp.]
MKTGNEHSMKEAVNKLLETYRIKQKFQETSVVAHWEEIMGTTIASRTSELFIRDGKLFLKLESSVLRNELRMARQKIVDLLNDRAGTQVISEVIFL